MENPANAILPIINKRYSLRYKNEYDQVEVLEGILVHPDLSGFLVFNLNDKTVLVPKDRVFVLNELDQSTPEKVNVPNP